MNSGDLKRQQESQQNNPQTKMTLHHTNTLSPNHSSSFSCYLHKDEKMADVGVCASTGVSIQLCYQTFGHRDSAKGVILLIMGLASPALLWDGHFCTALAAQGFYVIRFDNRDIGHSTFLSGNKIVPASSTSVHSGNVNKRSSSNSSSSSSSSTNTNSSSFSEIATGQDLNDLVEELKSNISTTTTIKRRTTVPSPSQSWFRTFHGLSSLHTQLAYASIMQGRHQFFRNVYTLNDMANDCVGLLNALHITQAHIVGMCMGGMIAQIIAIQHPTRVASLALISTHSSSTHTRWPTLREVVAIASAARQAAQMGFDTPQEEREKELLFVLKQKGENRRSALQRRREGDEAEFTQTLVSLLVGFAGGRSARYPVNRTACERQVRRVLRRSSDFSGVLRQYVALLNALSREMDLQHIHTPTIVLHGTIDPLVPYQNGKELAKLIPGARLLTFEGLGHILHPALREEFVAALVENIRQSRSDQVGMKMTSRL
ncbi:Alpha/beta hydrolase fold-1 [Trypanosoma melophagium]|uniref:Alpha/beta hydrolase fold-1 n=1 Tax=Trypanosoma melophagium TaxID=715481 RepID=UPI003519DFB2|nr:Alpha/beta hydrolase fold-1 [Trypanosoma melophagium]